MKIAILTPGGLGDETSGMHIPTLWDYVCRLSNYHEVTGLSLAPRNWTSPTGLCGGARIKFFPLHHKDQTLRKIWTLFAACRNDHRRHRFDLIHAFWAIPCGLSSVLLGKQLGIPTVVSFLGGETAALPQIHYGNMSRLPTRTLTLWIARRADALVTLTHHQRNELGKFGFVAAAENVIPFGANVELFSATEKDIAVRPLRFLSVASIYAVKDHLTLLKTFQLISQSTEARLRIVGEDLSNGQLHSFANSLGIRDKVKFMGHVNHQELAHHYGWAHVLLHTSLHEAQGVVIAEAAASGVLVAGTRTGLLADFGKQMAVVVLPADHRSLANGVLDIVSSQEKYDALRLASLEWARVHNANWTLQRYLNLYKTLSNAKRN